jgi:hypothetical protein
LTHERATTEELRPYLQNMCAPMLTVFGCCAALEKEARNERNKMPSQRAVYYTDVQTG